MPEGTEIKYMDPEKGIARTWGSIKVFSRQKTHAIRRLDSTSTRPIR